MEKEILLEFINETIMYLNHLELNEKFKREDIISDGVGERMNVRYLVAFLRPLAKLDEKIKKIFRFPRSWIERFEEVQSTTDSEKLAVSTSTDIRVSKIKNTWKIVETTWDLISNYFGGEYFTDKESILKDEFSTDFFMYIISSFPYSSEEYVEEFNKRKLFFNWNKIAEEAEEFRDNLVLSTFKASKEILEGEVSAKHAIIEEVQS